MNSETKRDLRKKMKQILADFHKNVTESQKSEITKNLCQKITARPEYKSAKIILAYIPSEFEADCTPVILDALKNGKKVAVPKVDVESMKTSENRMDFYFLEKDCRGKRDNNTSSVSFPRFDAEIFETQLEIGAYGIREPKSCLEKFSVAKLAEETSLHGDFDKLNHHIFILVPGVAFTREGKRLGHGKGFYDIYIEKMRKSGANPFLCGVCFPCQIVENLPTEAHDIFMNTIMF